MAVALGDCAGSRVVVVGVGRGAWGHFGAGKGRTVAGNRLGSRFSEANKHTRSYPPPLRRKGDRLNYVADVGLRKPTDQEAYAEVSDQMSTYNPAMNSSWCWYQVTGIPSTFA